MKSSILTAFLFLLAVLSAQGQSAIPAPGEVEFPTEPITAPPGYEVSHLWQILGFPSNQLLDANRLNFVKLVGITSLVSFVHWSEVESVGPDETTFMTYVTLRRKLGEHGLHWTPVLVANPFYSTPEWFRNSDKSVFARCLEHDQETPVQSIWNPHLRPHLQRFMRKVGEFCHQERDVVEAVRLGICGDFGETTYPSALGLDCPDSTHIHPGWWAGDRYAREDFRQWLKQRYGDADAVAMAWDISAAAVDRIATATGNLISLPEGPLAGAFIADASGLSDVHRQRFLDFVTWYQESLTRFTRQCLEDARRFFPGDRLELVVSGDGRPQLGADFSALTKAAREYQAGLWYVGMTNDYLSGFSGGRLLSSAARGYGVSYGTEEHLPNTEIGISGRFFDALSSGASGVGFRGLLIAGRFSPPSYPSRLWSLIGRTFLS
ncbi:MAG: family 14 glycosylhydrolase [bacterium]